MYEYDNYIDNNIEKYWVRMTMINYIDNYLSNIQSSVKEHT